MFTPRIDNIALHTRSCSSSIECANSWRLLAACVAPRLLKPTAMLKTGLCALLVVSACATDDDITQRLEWTALDNTTVPAGDPIELAVMTSDHDARVVDFFVDGQLVGTCDPSQPDEDCRLGDTWRWSVVFSSVGTHTVTASYESANGPIASTIELVVTSPALEDVAAPGDLDLTDDVDAAPPSTIEAVSRGSLDPSHVYLSKFGGIAWKMTNQRVVLHTGTPAGSVSSVASCMTRYGASIRKWATHYNLSRASIVATALTESSCTNPAGSSDGLSSGPMQVTASTCAALTGLSRTTCRTRMHTRPDFSFEVGAKYMASTYQRNQHHRDPPKIAAAYNAGSLRSTTANRWHMVSTGNHIDRFVKAYNAYRAWEAQHGVPRLVEPVFEPVFEGAHVGDVAELPAAADDGRVIFVGDFARRDGAFWQRIDGAWKSVDAED